MEDKEISKECLVENQHLETQTGDTQKIMEALDQLRKEIKELTKPKIYDTPSVMEILGVSNRLLQQYRNEGWLGYSRVGDKFWYTEKDVNEFLNKHHRDAFA